MALVAVEQVAGAQITEECAALGQADLAVHYYCGIEDSSV